MTQAALARIRFGCDPELFLSSKVAVDTYMDAKGKKRNKYDRRPIPVCGLVGGTKSSPLALSNKLQGWEDIPNIPSGAMVQEDGTALEFNTLPAPDTRRMVRDVNNIVEAIQNFSSRKGLEVWKKPSATFTEEVRTKFPHAFVIGCDPDINAYTNLQRTPPDDITKSLVRHAGGHFHVGYDKELVPPSIVVQFLDLFLGLPSIFVDKQGLRRAFYGQAGSYRVKEYGVEYRTLSNFWLPNIMGADFSEHFFNGVDLFMSRLMTNMDQLERLHKAINWEQVQTAINTENETMADQILGFGRTISKDLFARPIQFVGFAKQYLQKKSKESTKQEA